MDKQQEQIRYLEELKALLKSKGYDVDGTIELQIFGSVAINGDGQDIDYLMYVPYEQCDAIREVFREDGYRVNSSYGVMTDGWGSVKKDDIYNVIMYTDHALYVKQKAAFSICRQLQAIADSEMPKGLRRAIHEYLRAEYVDPDDYNDLLTPREQTGLVTTTILA